MAIGARSQSARTYLEKNFSVFADASLEDLVIHGLRALRDTLPPDATPGLTSQNCAVGFLGKDVSFKVIEDEAELQSLLDKLPPLPQRTVTTMESEPSAPSTEAMDVEDS